MRAETTAAYLDEPSVEAFRRKVGLIYPTPVTGKGSRQKWDRLQLDQAVAIFMAKAPSGSCCSALARRDMKRATDWPRYMKLRRLAGGRLAYYWVPDERDRQAGFSLGPEALGSNLGSAISRARSLNQHLDGSREGRDISQTL